MARRSVSSGDSTPHGFGWRAKVQAALAALALGATAMAMATLLRALRRVPKARAGVAERLPNGAEFGGEGEAGFGQPSSPTRARHVPPAAVPGTPGMLTGRPADEPTPSPIRAGASGFIHRSLKRIAEAILASRGKALRWATQFDNALLLLSLGIYLAVRLFRLMDYPIYFFVDEANQTLLAADFVRNGFRDFLGNLLPTYFQNVYAYNLSLSVYAQVLPYMLFGLSISVTRATSVLLTLPGALAIGLTHRRLLGSRYAWVGILLLSCSPAWFLHSRTAFETALMVSFYACFLCFYVLYRTCRPQYLYLAIVFAAAVFYTYGPGEIIILGTGLLLLAMDAPYHWAQRRTVAKGLVVVMAVALPYLRFRLQMPEKHEEALRLISSVWLTDAPLGLKLSTSLADYAHAVDLRYWFFPNQWDLGRHVMDGYGNLMGWSVPFVLAGLCLAVWRFRQPGVSSVLACVLAIPMGAAVAGGGITRLLAMVVPASILGAMGIGHLAGWLERWLRPRVIMVGFFVLLTAPSVSLLHDALTNGPLWNRNYGMEIPWGAPQVYGAIGQWHEQEPDALFIVSPTWANGVDTLRRFFLPDDFPVDIANTDRFTTQRQPLTDQMILVLTAREYEAALVNPKLADIRAEKIIPYPDGSPGFYFIRMRYSARADAIFEQERLERLKPITETLVVDGSTLTIEHPLLDSGTVQHMFDGDPFTLARGYEANPIVLKITFDTPRPLSGMDLTTGSMDIGLTVRLYAAGSSEPVVYAETYTDLPHDPTVSIDFSEGPAQVSRVEIEVLNLTEPGAAKIHLREIQFR